MSKTNIKKCSVVSLEAYKNNQQIIENSEYKTVNRIRTTRTILLLLLSPFWVPIYILGKLGPFFDSLIEGGNRTLHRTIERIYRKKAA